MAHNIDQKDLYISEDQLPKMFYEHGNKYNNFVSHWFFNGIDTKPLKEKRGINRNDCLLKIGKLLQSFTLEHNYKIALCAYWLNKWFDIQLD
jgi:hypothetical protein